MVGNSSINSSNTSTSKNSIKTVVLCGSFKFYKEMEVVASPLRKAGFEVIVPFPSHIRHGHKPELLKKVERINNRLMKQQKIKNLQEISIRKEF